MSGKSVEGVLKDFGLTEKEVEIYIFLAKHGPLKGGEISKQTKTHRPIVYRTLKSLQRKGVVESTLESPVRFTAVPFETVLDLKIKAKREEVTSIEKARKSLLSDWNKIGKTETEPEIAKFMVIEGNRKIYSKISEMIQETKSQFSAISTVPGLVRAEQFGLLDAIQNHPMKHKIQFRFITDVSSQNLKAIKLLLEKLDAGLSLKGRNPDVGLSLFPRMVIRDSEEILYFISPRTDQSDQEDYVCLFTNCMSLVKPFSGVFEDLWSNSTDIKQKISEIETGKLPSRTLIIKDAKAAKAKYDEALNKAKKEILIVASSKGIINFYRSMPTLKGWADRGVSIKIMSPIIGENLEAARALLSCCEVRHIPVGYLETAIIDEEHLFQFKNTHSIEDRMEETQNFENTFYTNDHEQVTKAKNMLTSIWKDSCTPSAISLESIINPPLSSAIPQSPSSAKYEFKFLHEYFQVKDIINVKPSGKITEKEVINKIINAKQRSVSDPSEKVFIECESLGLALIHPPSFFNLPKILIEAHHIDKNSTLGAEDRLVFRLLIKTPEGFKYVPVAVVGDNPRFYENRSRGRFRGTPAAQNYHLVKKDEIQIQVYGKTLLASWAIPIPLVPDKYTLPPAAILLEAYGKIRSYAYSIVHTLGPPIRVAHNHFEAFVTFLHESSKYTGPGTDGLLVRDYYMEVPLPQK